MIRISAGLALMLGSTAAIGASTDFGIRSVSGEAPVIAVSSSASAASWSSLRSGVSGTSLAAAIGIASRWGRVTSTVRSPAHNRRVGGVRNSFHLSGRAIDIARRPGVRHADIEAAFRNSGYRLIESLDEGDHSHFAFAWGGASAPPIRHARRQPGNGAQAGGTQWKMVFAPSSR